MQTNRTSVGSAERTYFAVAIRLARATRSFRPPLTKKRKIGRSFRGPSQSPRRPLDRLIIPVPRSRARTRVSRLQEPPSLNLRAARSSTRLSPYMMPVSRAYACVSKEWAAAFLPHRPPCPPLGSFPRTLPVFCQRPARVRACVSSSGARPAVRAGRSVPPHTRASPARLGARYRLHELGTVVPQIHICRTRRHLRDPRDQQSRAHERRSRRWFRQAPRPTPTPTNPRALGRWLSVLERRGRPIAPACIGSSRFPRPVPGILPALPGGGLTTTR